MQPQDTLNCHFKSVSRITQHISVSLELGWRDGSNLGWERAGGERNLKPHLLTQHFLSIKRKKVKSSFFSILETLLQVEQLETKEAPQNLSKPFLTVQPLRAQNQHLFQNEYKRIKTGDPKITDC